MIEAVLRAVPRLPRPEPPPPEHEEWWERGVLDGVETMKVFAQEALAMIERLASEDSVPAVRLIVADLEPLFATTSPRRADGRLDEVWIVPRRYNEEAE
jgi:hypothetical protein